MDNHLVNKRQKLEEESVESAGATSNCPNLAANSSSRQSMEPLFGKAANIAMQNNLILEKISRNLPAKTLSTLRPTCTTWNENFVAQLKEKHQPIQLCHTGEGHRMLNEFMEVVKSSKTIPFANYSLYDDLTTQGEDGNWIFQEFFSLCGQSIKTLTLTCTLFGERLESPWNINRIREILFQHTPNVEKLTVEMKLPQEAIDSSVIWTAAEKELVLQEHFESKPLPKLKHLSLQFRTGLQLAEPPPLFQAVTMDLFRCAVGLEKLELYVLQSVFVLRCFRDLAPAVQQLKSLAFASFNLQGQDMELLTELARRRQNPLRLQQFTVSLSLTARPGDLQTFLRTQAGTLRRLKVGMLTRRGTNPDKILLPRIPGLRHLILYVTGQAQLPLHFEGGTLVSAFPELDNFECSYALRKGDHNPQQQRPNNVMKPLRLLSHPGVTKLSLTDANMGDLDSPGSLARFADVLPSVVSLKLILTVPTDSTSWGPLWTVWPNLRCLEIVDKRGDLIHPNKLFSGVPTRKLKSLVQLLLDSGSLGSLDSIREILDQHRTWCAPGVGELKHLQKLTFTWDLGTQGDDGREVMILSDAGVLFGLAFAAPTLHHVAIKTGEHEREWVSAEARAVLRSVMGPFAVIDL